MRSERLEGSLPAVGAAVGGREDGKAQSARWPARSGSDDPQAVDPAGGVPRS